jgi:type II secretory pathway component PulM
MRATASLVFVYRRERRHSPRQSQCKDTSGETSVLSVELRRRSPRQRRFLNAAGMLAALVLLAAFWLIGAMQWCPGISRGVEGKGMALEALVD